MSIKIFLLALLTFSAFAATAQKGSVRSKEAVYLDNKGVIRWSDSKKEVSLYGANYCLPSACDYRAAGHVSSDRKAMIDQDMAHFARMGFDAVRLCFWGDFENTDAEGNLVQNDHLELMDYLIAKAKERGIFMLLSPIVTYSSLFPDAMRETDQIKGSLSATFKKGELGTNPKAIAAQCNYIRQLLRHINPYTKTALKDDPSIVFIEMINEPTHHAEDLKGSIAYINALVDAVRSTGCSKLVFHNVSQDDFTISEAMGKSNVQGATFAWYPSGLNSGRQLNANFLPVVDEFNKEMLNPNLNKLGRIVYEFDSPDQITGFMYPAMARSFRRMGAQWASIFSYDMLGTAPYNLGWQTHYINMVYTPTKAVSAMISAEIMRTIPMFKDYGKYPTNTRFGDFRLSYDEDLAELNSPSKFYYTSSTSTNPVDLKQLTKIAGTGSSPVVAYEGKGIYFADKIDDATWRLEVYPDALPVRDPFESPGVGKVVTRSISRAWPISLKLPGLESDFQVIPLNSGNTYRSKGENSTFTIRPGVYIVTSKKDFTTASLPKKIGQTNMSEYVMIDDQRLPLQIISKGQLFSAGKPLSISANVIHSEFPEQVTLYVKTPNSRRGFASYPMQRKEGYRYEASVPWSDQFAAGGAVTWCIVAKNGDQKINFPSGSPVAPGDASFTGCETWEGRIMAALAPVKLVQVEKDLSQMAFTRIGDNVRGGVYKTLASARDGDVAIHLELPLSYDKNLDDYTASVDVKDKLSTLSQLQDAKRLLIRAKGLNGKQESYVTLVEKDGTGWSAKIPLTADWSEIEIPLSSLKPARGAMLPLGYPGRWPYWFRVAEGRGKDGDKVKLADVERAQISIRPSSMSSAEMGASFIDVSSILLGF